MTFGTAAMFRLLLALGTLRVALSVPLSHLDMVYEQIRTSMAPEEERRLFHSIEDPTHRHASVYLNYVPPSLGTPLAAWYQTIEPRRSTDATFFAMGGHRYGYIGLQQVYENPFEGKVIFSIWDREEGSHDAAEVLECGDNAICTTFHGEGTGAQSYMNFHEWELHREYHFLTRAYQEEAGKVRYEGYFFADEFGGWVLLSKIKVSTGTLDWHIHGMFSFVEQWKLDSSHDARWARVGPTFVRGENQYDTWTQVTSATYSHTDDASTEDTTHVNANVTSGGGRWAFGIGGNIVNNVNLNDVLTVSAADACPSQLASFDASRRQDALPTGQPRTQVSCGNHQAASCELCIVGGDRNWCNGECVWSNEVNGVRYDPGTCEHPAPGRRLAASASSASEGASRRLGMSHSVSNAQAICTYDGNMSPVVTTVTPPASSSPASSCSVSNAVLCGGHRAACCQECPFNPSGQNMGSGWCNGDCSWDGTGCVDPSATTSTATTTHEPANKAPSQSTITGVALALLLMMVMASF